MISGQRFNPAELMGIRTSRELSFVLHSIRLPRPLDLHSQKLDINRSEIKQMQ